jgi:O-acetyl-ADP-ribose deacetylase (regulator of RNase III)
MQIVFPCVVTGASQYSKERWVRDLVSEVRRFLHSTDNSSKGGNIKKVTFVASGEEEFEIYAKAVTGN